MSSTDLLRRYLDPLLRGQRQACRNLVRTELESGIPARTLYHELIFPAMERVERLYREDRINLAAEHMATRINRVVAEQIQTRLPRSLPQEKRLVITCAHGEAEEFSAQVCADLFEADGWDVYLLGGGVPYDDTAAVVGRLQPQILLIIGSRPGDAPHVRQMIDYVRSLNACPTMNIMVFGGVFGRAAGLWKEVKADLFAETASEALELAAQAPPRKPELRMPGAPKKRRRRRRPPLLAQVEAEA
jgi:methanogenic corrinoid protein MtbC1